MSTILFDTIKTQSKVTNSVIVAFSGGKDSIVTLDLCFRYFKHVQPFFMYICPDLSFQERMLRWYENKYNTEIIRVPHMDVSEFFHYGSFRLGDPTFPIVSINDIYKWIRLESDIWWIAAGERINDSIVRRAMMKKSGSIDTQRGRFYPVSMWKKQEILDYIKFHKLYLGEDSKKLGFSFRSLAGNELAMVKKVFPEDYDKIINLYPFAEAGVKRYEDLVGGHQRLEQLDALEKSQDYELTVCVVDVDEREEAALNVQLNNPSMQGEWDFDKLAMMSEEFDLDLKDDLGFTESDIDFMFEGDDRFSQLFETKEGEHMRGALEAVKEARKESTDKLKERNNIDWYTVIVFENEKDREDFMKAISIPIHEKYITEEQLRRLFKNND